MRHLNDLRNARIQHLILSREIMRRGSLAAAAVALNMTQSAATKSLNALETLLGLTLFERHSSGLRPTRRGEVFIHRCDAILMRLDDAVAHIRDMKPIDGGRVRVATLIAATSDLLPRTLVRLGDTSPQISVVLSEGTDSALREQLVRGEIDIICGRIHVARPDRQIEEHDLYRDDIVLVARDDHPMLNNQPLPAALLTSAPWILPPDGTSLRSEIEQEFRKLDIDHVDCAIESVVLAVNLNLLATGKFLGVMPRRVFEQHRDNYGLATLPYQLESTQSRIGYCVAAGQEHDPALQRFISTLRNTAVE